jgi:predicted TIM-barrel enzyme
MTGEEARALLRATAREGGVIIGAGAGTGLSAKCAEAGGGDLIIIYNSGRYRMAGRGSLAGLMPYGDANAIVLDMAREVLPVVQHTPVLAGVCGTDPFRLMPRFLAEVEAVGFAGVQNFPTVGLIDGTFRANLEETGMGFALEVDMIAEAARAERGDVIVLCHGGPIAEPQDAAHVLKHAKACHGFYGASSMERLPVERALTEQTRAFKAI